MMRSCPPRQLTLTLTLALACGCAREPAPRANPAVAPEVTRAVDPVVAYLAETRAGLAQSANATPEAAATTLRALRARPVPSGLDPNESALLLAEIDRESALVWLDAGHVDEAVTAIERALAAAEAASVRDRTTTAGLLLTAEAVYRRAGRVDSAAWAHREAALFVAGDTGR